MIVELRQIVENSRSADRYTNQELVNKIFTKLFEIHGDGLQEDDPSVMTGLGLFKEKTVGIVAIKNGKTNEEKIKYNFSSPKPSGYRKALKMMKISESLKIPLITFINTPGADASVQSEYDGQSKIIAKCIEFMGQMKQKTISVFNGEGESGGSLALSNSKYVIMSENSIFSVASPEALFSILKKDPKNVENWQFLEKIPMTPQKLKRINLIDEIVPETNNKMNIAFLIKKIGLFLNV